MSDNFDRRAQDEQTKQQCERKAAAGRATPDPVRIHGPSSTSGGWSNVYLSPRDSAYAASRLSADRDGGREDARGRDAPHQEEHRVQQPIYNDPQVWSESNSRFRDIQQYNGGSGHPESFNNDTAEDILSGVPGSIFGGAQAIQRSHASDSYATYDNSHDTSYSKRLQFTQLQPSRQHYTPRLPPPSATGQQADRFLFPGVRTRSSTPLPTTRSQIIDRRPSGRIQNVLVTRPRKRPLPPSTIPQQDVRSQPRSIPRSGTLPEYPPRRHQKLSSRSNYQTPPYDLDTPPSRPHHSTEQG